MKEFNGRVIYNPSGRAGEYSYWAVIKLASPWTDLFKIGLESGAKYPKREIDFFYNAVMTFWETTKPVSRIYWKDGFLKAAKIEREELPEFCVNRDYNLFNHKIENDAVQQ